MYEMVRPTNSINLLTLGLLQIVLTFSKIEQGEAIQCFVCNSKSDPRCADPIQTDWQGSDEQGSERSDESNDGLEPVECHLAVQYSAGIQAVSDLFRGFGHARLGLPDLWVSTSASLSPNSGFSGSSGGYNRGYGGRGHRGSSSWGTYGGTREQEESMGCHKVVYTESNGDSVVDRGCAPARVANTDPCSALDSATSNNDNGNYGNTGSSGSSSGFGGGYGGGGNGGGNGGTLDLTQITADFCEVCNDNGCNKATNLTVNSLFIFILSILNTYLTIL